jgi:hypothetical protein
MKLNVIRGLTAAALLAMSASAHASPLLCLLKIIFG